MSIRSKSLTEVGSHKKKKGEIERAVKTKTFKNAKRHRGRAKASAHVQAAGVTDSQGRDIENPT